MKLSDLKMSVKETVSDTSGIFSKSKSRKYTIVPNVLKSKKQRLFILSFFFVIPFVSFSTPTPTKRVKKTKMVKAVKRNILEIEFGTFKYESPVISKKSVFLG